MRTMQTSFAAGELAPALHAHVDLQRYQTGLKTCRNFFVRVYGGVANRPGFILAGKPPVSADHPEGEPTWLMSFKYNNDQGYALAWSDLALRIYAKGGPLLVAPCSAAIQNGNFDDGTAGWTDLSDGGTPAGSATSTKLVPGATGTPIGSATGGGGLAAAFDSTKAAIASACASESDTILHVGKDWGSGVTKKIGRVRVFGSKEWGLRSGSPARSVNVVLQGSTDNFVSSVKELARERVVCKPGQVVDIDDGVVTSTAYRYHRIVVSCLGDHGQTSYVGQVEFYELVAGSGPPLISAGNLTGWIEQAVSIGQLRQIHVVAFRVVSGTCYCRIGTTSGGSQLVDDVECPPGWHTVEFSPTTATAYLGWLVTSGSAQLDSIELLGSGATSPREYRLRSPYRERELAELGFVQSADVLTLVHPSHKPRELRRRGNTGWQLVDIAFGTSLKAPIGVTATKFGDHGGSTTYAYVVVAENEADDVHSFASSIATVTNCNSPLSTTDAVDVNWSSVAGADRYSVFRKRNGIFGYVGSTKETTFRDDGIAPQLGDTPRQARNPFAGKGNYPGAVGYYQGRLVLGGSDSKPETFELSRTGDFHNFSRSLPTKDDDAITATAVGTDGQVNRILHLVGQRSLLLLTSGAEFRLERGDKGLTPALEGGLEPQGLRGAARVRPLVIGEDVLYVQALGSIVRGLTYDRLAQAFSSVELSLLSEHLLRGREIVQWAWAQQPYQLVWAVRDDGRLLSLSYLREQEVTGWARHDTTKGRFESVCTVTEGGRDVLYAVVLRRLSSGTRRFVERLADREVPNVRDAVFMDCALSLDDRRRITDVVKGPGYITVQVALHGWSAGDLVELDGLQGATELNGKQFKIANVTGDTFRLYRKGKGLVAINPAEVGAWEGGGGARRAVTEVSGLDHLEGESVAVLADGNVHPRRTVSGGKITLNYAASRVHVGLPITAELETLALPLDPELYGRKKAVKGLQLFVNSTRAVMVGPAGDRLSPYNFRTDEDWDEPTRPTSGLIEVTIEPSWGFPGQVLVRQSDPLPIEVLASLPVFDVGG